MRQGRSLLPSTALCLGMLLSAAPDPAVSAAAEAPRLDSLGIPFIAHADETGIHFTARTPRGVVSVTPSGEIHYLLPRNGEDRPDLAGVVLREALVGAAVREVAGRGRAPTRVNVLYGSDPSRWQRNLPAFHGVSLGEVYPGVEMTLRVRGRSVEKIFEIAAGADADRIRLRIDGGHGLSVTPDGELAVVTRLGEVRFSRPVAYQDRSGAREPVAVAYRLRAGDEYGFALGPYDRSRPLVVDPILAATYYGGDGHDEVFAIGRNSGGVYIGGEAFRHAVPGVSGGSADPVFQNAGSIYTEGFVARLNPSLTTILDATFLGGAGDDMVAALVLDPSGDVYVAGVTSSPDFPGVGGGAAGPTRVGRTSSSRGSART